MLAGWPKRRHLFLYIGATVAVTALTFFMLLTNESYVFAKEFVANDSRVRQVTGSQKSSRIAPFKGFRSTFGDRTGEAHFTFKVSADRGSFDVRVEMEKREGRWNIIKAQVASSSGAVTNVVGAQSWPRQGQGFVEGAGVKSCFLQRLTPSSPCPRG